MIKVKLGKYEASIDRRVWTSDNKDIETLLNSYVPGLFLHAGHSDVDQEIVDQTSKHLPIEVISNDRRSETLEKKDQDEVKF